jgi:hypothetical protein
MKQHSRTWLALAFFICGLIGWPIAGAAEASAATEVGKIMLVVGEAKIAGKAVKVGDSVLVGAELTTGADGYLYLKTVDSGFLILRPGSVAIVEAYKVDLANPAQSRFKFSLRQGVARSISGDAVGKARKNFRFNTPVAAIGVRGTDFSIYTNAEETRVAVVSGGVIVSSFDGKCLPQGSGPCEGTDSLELFAGTLGVLQVQKGQTAPRLIEDRTLSPDIVAPPRHDEPSLSVAPVADKRQKDSEDTVSPSPSLDHQDVLLDPVKQEQLQPITWGRWQQISEKLPATVDISDLDKTIYGMITIPDNSYILLWNKNDTNTVKIPASSNLSFSLQAGQAHITGADGRVTPASVNNGMLNFNFDQSSFFTRVELGASGQNHTLYANGGVTRDGIFYSNENAPGNMLVRGALFQSKQAQDMKDMTASYVFQSTLRNGLSASGVTVWDKPVQP